MNNDSREKNSIRNISIGLFYQMISLVMNFLVKTVFIRTLVPDFWGINGLFTNIFTIFSFAEFGIGVAMSYSLYKPIVSGDRDKISGLYKYYKKLYRIMSLCITVAGVLLIPFLPYIVKTETEINGIVIYYLVFLINIILYNLFIFKTYVLIADQRKYIVSVIQIVMDVLGFSALMAVLWISKDYLVYLMILSLKTVVFSIVIHLISKKYYPFLESGNKISDNEKEVIKRNVKDLFVYRFSMVLVNGTDNIIISIMVGTLWVGYYSNYDLIIMGISSLVAIVYGALSASLGNLIAEKSNESAKELFSWVQTMSMWLSGVMVVCLIILFQDFIKLWAGEKYLLSMNIVVIITINFYISCIRDSMKIFRETLGVFSRVKYIMIANAVINLILSVLLGYIFGIFGVLVSTAIAAVLTYFWFEPMLIYKEMKSKKFYEYFGFQVLSVVLIAINLFITYQAVSVFELRGITGFFIKAGMCFIISNLIYYIILGRTKAVKYIIKAGRNYFSHKKKS